MICEISTKEGPEEKEDKKEEQKEPSKKIHRFPTIEELQVATEA